MSKYEIRSLNDVVITRMKKKVKYKKKGFIYIPISFSIKGYPKILKIINRWKKEYY